MLLIEKTARVTASGAAKTITSHGIRLGWRHSHWIYTQGQHQTWFTNSTHSRPEKLHPKKSQNTLGRRQQSALKPSAAVMTFATWDTTESVLPDFPHFRTLSGAGIFGSKAICKRTPWHLFNLFNITITYFAPDFGRLNFQLFVGLREEVPCSNGWQPRNTVHTTSQRRNIEYSASDKLPFCTVVMSSSALMNTNSGESALPWVEQTRPNPQRQTGNWGNGASIVAPFWSPTWDCHVQQNRRH